MMQHIDQLLRAANVTSLTLVTPHLVAVSAPWPASLPPSERNGTALMDASSAPLLLHWKRPLWQRRKRSAQALQHCALGSLNGSR